MWIAASFPIGKEDRNLRNNLSVKELSKLSSYLEKNGPDGRSLFMYKGPRQGHVNSHVLLAYINGGRKCK